MSQISRILHIHGRVQGVGFRDWAVEQARELKVNGWVRNREDGSVEVLISGEEPAVRDLMARCHTGPAKSRVECIDVESVQLDQAVDGFSRKNTL